MATWIGVRNAARASARLGRAPPRPLPRPGRRGQDQAGFSWQDMASEKATSSWSALDTYTIDHLTWPQLEHLGKILGLKNLKKRAAKNKDTALELISRHAWS